MKTLNRIDWKSVPNENIDPAQWATLVDELREIYGEPTPPKQGCRYKTTPMDTTWWIEGTSRLYWLDPETGFPRKTYCGEPIAVEPHKAWAEVWQLIKGTYGTDLWEAMPAEHYNLRCCVPSQINWCAARYANQPLLDVHKADISSAFPYEATKRLPTLVGSKIVYGERPQPTSDFPFVFGSNGSMVFVEEDGTIIDTDNLFNSRFYCGQTKHKLARLTVAEANNYQMPLFDYWLVCRATEGLGKVFGPLYALKQKGDQVAKAIMNYFIGYCWKQSKPAYLHLAAVILARCDTRMIKLAEDLINRGNTPLLIVTDSIAWKGDPAAVEVSNTKQLGAFNWESKSCTLMYAGPKAYQLSFGDGTTITRWAGVDQATTAAMPFGAIAHQQSYVTSINGSTTTNITDCWA